MTKRKKTVKNTPPPAHERVCPDVVDLPSIQDPKGKLEVFVPGSVYQPLLLRSPDKGVHLSPGALDVNEAKFVTDLVTCLGYKGSRLEPHMPLTWQGKDIWIQRNIENNPKSFRLAVDGSDWFYPDFLVWIVDYESRLQTIGFVDPKGLAMGSPGGWSDYKIVATVFMPHLIELELGRASDSGIGDEGWTYRIRGVLLSTTRPEVLAQYAKFAVLDEKGNSRMPSESDFKLARIIFQERNISYIPEILRLLNEDTPLDRILDTAAQIIFHGDNFTPQNAAAQDIANKRVSNPDNYCDFVAALIRDCLKR